ncbi:diguanylate cyclase (GGDEF) domain-containing protein [Fibrobacter sp. UWB15]|uniref:sensor domain-containing diguanylate cyclase n=1 Tax=unclassified Fibrobacter TaxID=2634177 RepID=UPI00091485D3|nr:MULTISPECIES: sensor domain-containing diguanylate cyclase [unclassified Fibrobacter]PWJ63158.1 diguanylate cyclase (GGDEF)-like protein [Fibrobacter sp. UWB6]SHG41447.1 diguanylate cyclase (GGDEF) domain-containing protein [Fibrobacter sp. UWB8]SMG38153.1 diguanylate cyclase (GGDEF) domain-containing protein [Fibrobacter sp. UWB15]
MDFDKILSHYKAKACVMSVELYPDGSYGNIRVVAGNKAHCEEMESTQGRPFVPDCPYEFCFPKNQNFEDHCFRCVQSGKPLHAYVNLYMMGLWLNMFLMPLDSDREDVGYCVYCYDVAPKADSSAMADLSGDTASNVLKACIKLRGAENVKQTFQEVVEDIRKSCESDQCCILLTDAENRECSIFAESTREGLKVQPMSRYVEGFYAIAETWPETLAGSTCIIVKDERDMEKLRLTNPIWGSMLDLSGVKTIMLFPLRHGGELLGYLWTVNFNVDNTLIIKETLEVTTFLIASEISSYLLLNKLQTLSTIDSLTGVKNRNVMNNRIDQIVAGRKPTPKAVIFADLNGLKYTNDEQGHLSGDKVLRSAAEILQYVFPKEDVYRAGGDEFMVLASDITEDELNTRIAKIRTMAKLSENVYFSIGVCCGEPDVRRAMHVADERMYVDKKSFYIEHPELKYR